MLIKSKAFSGFSGQRTSKKAQAFYSQTLGLKSPSRHGMLHLHLDGGGTCWVSKPNHTRPRSRSSTSPCPTWTTRGTSSPSAAVRFEQYNLPDLKTDAKGIARGAAGTRHRVVQGSGGQPFCRC